MFSPFDNPEIKKLFSDLLDSLFDESGRGALLIATSHVDDHLTKLIESSLPSDLSNTHKDKLFRYPGPLSSFSSKIELAYVFRLIGKNLYDSLNALRKLRNDAAHSLEKFELHELNEKLKPIYNLGPGVSAVIRETSITALVKFKADLVKKILDESEIEEEAKKEIFEKTFKDKDKLEILEKQIPFWELVYGLSLLCGLIVYYKDKTSKLTKDLRIWSDLLKENFEPEEKTGP